MKPLVITHTLWIHQLIVSWAYGPNTPVEEVFPITSTSSVDARIAKAQRLLNSIRRVQPDIILDVNGVGILPLDKDATRWLPEEAGVPWCIWWWDRPCFPSYTLEHECLPGWRNALRHPATRLFMWDEPLSREYSVWLEKPVHWLPTATHPTIFKPPRDAYNPAEVRYDACFLGAFLDTKAAHTESPDTVEIERIAHERFRHPDRMVFDIASHLGTATPRFAQLLVSEYKNPIKGFSEKYIAWQKQTDGLLSSLRRTPCLETIRRHFPSNDFQGANWPPEFNAQPGGNFRPESISSRYFDALLCPDPGNGQAYSGTAMRPYEIMSSGAILVCRKYPDFDPDGALEGHVYLAFEDVAELPDIRQRLLQAPRMAGDIRRQARQFVMERHTWRHRLQYLVKVATAAPAPPEANRGS